VPNLPSLGSVTGLPADAIAALRQLPDIAENTRVMKEHTAALERVADALDRVAADTGVLRKMDKRMAAIEKRMAAIEKRMPLLADVQRDLAELPEIIEGLKTSADTLHQAVQPLGRLAGRVPGQRKG
jgi:DNA repair ATPase RecN